MQHRLTNLASNFQTAETFTLIDANGVEHKIALMHLQTFEVRYCSTIRSNVDVQGFRGIIHDKFYGKRYKQHDYVRQGSYSLWHETKRLESSEDLQMIRMNEVVDMRALVFVPRLHRRRLVCPICDGKCKYVDGSRRTGRKW